jgi:dolichol-phosphate mannosyltransferase
MYDLTVIIPTYCEEANIRKIIDEVDAVFRQNSLRGEILVVDDNSPDRTIALVNEIRETKRNVSLLVRTEDPGLSQSVADGFVHAQSDVFIVIDADLSHPPALIPVLYREILAGSDIVVGSRYMKGGSIGKWPLMRRIISLVATFLGRLLFPDITDPVSGFFAVRRSVVAGAPLRPRGYKILLEVLGKGAWENAREIPFEFIDRATGESKLKGKTIVEYARQVCDIAAYSFLHHESAAWKEWGRVFRFGLVGISGIVVNQGILIYLKEFQGFAIPVASAIAIEVSILNNFLWNDLWTFKENRAGSRWWGRLAVFQVISIGGAAINYAILNLLALIAGIDYRIANIIGILVAFGWNFLVNRHFTWGR